MYRALRAPLLAVAIAAALSFTTTSAFALSVVQEPSGTACGNTVTPTNHGSSAGGGCGLKVNGATVEIGTALGMATCNSTFEARIGGNGVGYAYAQTLTVCTPVPVIPCAGDEPGTSFYWPLTVASETTANMSVCAHLFGLPWNCTFTLSLSQALGTHALTLSTGVSHQACRAGSSNSIQGTWTSVIDAAHPAFEIVD